MPGLYRMLQPLVAAGFVGMFARPLSFFQAAIEISAAYNDQKSFHEFGGLCARRIAHCMSNILRAMVPKCIKRFVNLG